MARVTGVSLCSLLTRGQQIKVVSQLLRKVSKTVVIDSQDQLLEYRYMISDSRERLLNACSSGSSYRRTV